MATRQRLPELEMTPDPAHLVERYFMDVYSICFRVLGHPQDAEDATQETFLALFRERERMAGVASVEAWVRTVARNRAISLSRLRPPARPLIEEVDEAAPIEEPPDTRRLHEALARSSEEDRRLLQMRFLEGKGLAEMADEVGRTAGATATALCRALQRLRWLYQRGTRS